MTTSVVQSRMTEKQQQDAGLCEYCSQISFAALSLPTAKELQVLREGQRPPSRELFEDANNNDTYAWSLGLQSRVSESSRTCRLCKAICFALEKRSKGKTTASAAPNGIEHLLCIAEIRWVGDLRPPIGKKWASLKAVRLRRLSIRWRQAQESDTLKPEILSGRRERRFDTEYQLPQCFQTCSVGLKRETRVADGNNFVFGGRLVPPAVDPEMVSYWLRRCRRHHIDICSRQLAPW